MQVALPDLDAGGLFQAFLDSTPDWLFAKDLQHRFLFVNRSFAAAIGRTPAELVGRSDTEFWSMQQCEPDPASGHQGFHADDRRAFAGETVHNPQDRATVADGSVRVFDTVKSPLRAADGRIVGVLCYCRDVTERVQAAAALGESERLFRALVASIPGSVYRSETAPPYRDLFLSDGIENITGYAAAEYLTADGLRCGDLILPEDRALVDAEVAAAVAAHRSYHVRYRIRHRDGSVRWVSDNGRAIHGADGAPLYLVGVHLDITQEMTAAAATREREELLAAVVEATPECVKLLDHAGRVLTMNPAGLRMVEADDLTQLRGRGLLTMVHAEDRAAFQEMLAAVFRGESRTLAFRIAGLRGTPRTLATHSVPLWTDAGRREVRALLGTTRDITEQLRAEQAHTDLERQMRHAHKMQAIGTLAGGIAHDFNNVLTAILGHAELLQQAARADRAASATVLGGAESILVAAQRARDLVRQILTFSSRRELPRQLTRLQPVVREALQLLRASLPANIEIRTDLSCGEEVLLADATQLHQVVMNLCTNAAQAMHQNGGVLTVGCGQLAVDARFCRTHPGTRPGMHAVLTVRDTGHGMAPAVRERIFEPFFTTRATGEGAGLGLAVVHGIVQAHQGAIEVDTTPDIGTEIRVYLPIADRVPDDNASQPPSPARGRGQRLLLVDDEQMLVDLAGRMLTELDYQVIGHTRWRDALAEFDQHPDGFDLVLCDLTMPGMNGLQFAQRLHAIRPHLPVVLLSGFLDATDPQQLQQAGIRELLGKPFRLHDLAAVVERHALRR